MPSREAIHEAYLQGEEGIIELIEGLISVMRRVAVLDMVMNSA